MRAAASECQQGELQSTAEKRAPEVNELVLPLSRSQSKYLARTSIGPPVV